MSKATQTEKAWLLSQLVRHVDRDSPLMHKLLQGALSLLPFHEAPGHWADLAHRLISRDPKTSGVLHDAVIDNNEATLLYSFFRHMPSILLERERVEDALIEIGKTKWLIDVAEQWGANVPKLQKAVEASGDADEMYWFARKVKDANLDDLWEAIEATGSTKYKDFWLHVNPPFQGPSRRT